MNLERVKSYFNTNTTIGLALLTVAVCILILELSCYYKAPFAVTIVVSTIATIVFATSGIELIREGSKK